MNARHAVLFALSAKLRHFCPGAVDSSLRGRAMPRGTLQFSASFIAVITGIGFDRARAAIDWLLDGMLAAACDRSRVCRRSRSRRSMSAPLSSAPKSSSRKTKLGEPLSRPNWATAPAVGFSRPNRSLLALPRSAVCFGKPVRSRWTWSRRRSPRRARLRGFRVPSCVRFPIRRRPICRRSWSGCFRLVVCRGRERSAAMVRHPSLIGEFWRLARDTRLAARNLADALNQIIPP